jgi:hypothetical protein
MFCKELIPDIANELAALILPEDANDPIVLSLNVSLKLLKSIECVALPTKGKHPAMTRRVVNEGEPVSKASGGERWYLVQIAVNALEKDLGAMQCLVRERGSMMLAMNTRDADASKWIVAVKLKACCKRILDNKLHLIASNVTQASMPERLR